MGLQGTITLVYIEVKREAAFAGDAQQEAMMYYAQDCKELRVAGTKTLQPAVLLTVSTGVMLPCANCLLALMQSLYPEWVLASDSCMAGKCLPHLSIAVQQLRSGPVRLFSGKAMSGPATCCFKL